MKGNFIPENTFKKGKAFLMRNKDDADNACAEILRQKRKFICVNDVLEEQYYDYAKEHVLNALETIMPGKSEFEL